MYSMYVCTVVYEWIIYAVNVCVYVVCIECMCVCIICMYSLFFMSGDIMQEFIRCRFDWANTKRDR